MLRTALLGGNTITLDADLSKYIETVSDQGVIEGLEVNSNSVAPGKAWVKATRSNGETIMVLVQNTEALAVDTSGTKKIWLEIRQEAIDNGLLNNEDGTGIASIKTGPSVPSQNFLLLASVADGVITDERNLIPKIQSVAQRTDSLEEKMTNAEGQISQLVEAGTPDHLMVSDIVGEKYQLSDVLTRHYLPQLAESVIPLNFGEVIANKELHIQRIGSGQTDNKIKIKLRKKGNPSSNVIVEVRKGIKVETGSLVYRYGGEVLATATIPANQITTSRKEFTATLDKSPLLARGELYSIVVKCQNSVYHGSDYYQVACGPQRSECFCTVQVNDTTRTRIDYEVYCESLLFQPYCLAKIHTSPRDKTLIEQINFENDSSHSHTFVLTEDNQPIRITAGSWGISYVELSKNNQKFWTHDWISSGRSVDLNVAANKGDIVRIYIRPQTTSDASFSIYSQLQKKINQKHYPKAIKQIGEMAECVLFGVYGNKIVGEQINSTISKHATTGLVLLGNAVGFMTILGADGKAYKIPVYGE